MKVLENMQTLHAKLEEIKPNFATYIQNKAIPLEERWAVFSLAPSNLKEYEEYGPDFDTLHPDFIMYDGPVHMERGQTMSTLDLIESIKESLKDLEENSYCGREWAEKLLKVVDVNALKEEIMEKNLHSFNYDW